MNHPRPTSRAFTLMELIVAVSLTLVMMVLVSQIFNSTGNLIRQGTARGDAVANAGAVDSTMRRDAKFMVGPHENNGFDPERSGGILLITQAQINARLEAPNNRTIYRPVRADQLVFITRRQLAQNPLAPASGTDYSAANDQGIARFVRVSYGHGVRTQPDGSDIANDATPDALNNINFLGYPGGLNGDAQRWVLTRQALMLGEEPPAGSTTVFPPNHGANGWAHAVGAFTDANVTRLPTGSAPAKLYMGLTDYAYFSFDDPLLGTVPHTVGAIVGGALQDATRPDAATRLWADPVVNYAERAVANYTFSRKRLRVNPVPDPSLSASDLQAWQIAQIHPYLMEYCSDFAIEFAADLFTQDENGRIDAAEPDGIIDYTPAINLPHPDPAVDAGYGFDSVGNLVPDIAAGAIMWYTAPALANHPQGPDAPFDATAGFNSARGPMTWPYQNPATDLLITAAYNPLVTTAFANAPAAFVFRHDDEGIENSTQDIVGKWTGREEQTSFWPYLLRVRYKLHDARGQLQAGNVAGWPNDGIDNDGDGRTDENGTTVPHLGPGGPEVADFELDNGIWFEQVIPVNRPPTPPPAGP